MTTLGHSINSRKKKKQAVNRGSFFVLFCFAFRKNSVGRASNGKRSILRGWPYPVLPKFKTLQWRKESCYCYEQNCGV